MLDTIRLEITDFRFYFAVSNWRNEDLSGFSPARINVGLLKEMVEDGKVMDFLAYKDRKISELLQDMNSFGLDVVVMCSPPQSIIFVFFMDRIKACHLRQSALFQLLISYSSM